MDEIFGFLPPVGNPPSKMPMLTLLKQARAFGLGLVLATQNPVDLDYKALSNAGTWFIGRLQTERDKARVLDGLEGASAAAGSSFDRQDYDRILSGLGNRVFLMNNTHEDEPVVMTTRWALSYLRGPLTREQICTLMAPLKAVPTPAEAAAATQPAPAALKSTLPTLGAAATVPAASAPHHPGNMPVLPSEVQQVFIPARSRQPAGCVAIYFPRVLGSARISFADSKTRTSTVRQVQYIAEITDSPIPVDWQTARVFDLPLAELEKRPEGQASFGVLPGPAALTKSYAAWSRELVNWLYANQSIELLQSPSQKIISKPGEDERDFRLRLSQTRANSVMRPCHRCEKNTNPG